MSYQASVLQRSIRRVPAHQSAQAESVGGRPANGAAAMACRGGAGGAVMVERGVTVAKLGSGTSAVLCPA